MNHHSHSFRLAIRQGLAEKILTDATTATCGATVFRPWSVVDVRLDEKDPENSPVIATLKSQYGERREVRARYVVGCDGGRSNVRQAMKKYGVELEGDAHDSVWCELFDLLFTLLHVNAYEQLRWTWWVSKPISPIFIRSRAYLLIRLRHIKYVLTIFFISKDCRKRTWRNNDHP
jgi:2-polyprenyl-6-methoxyphenol hydroxylase-like FAD-dependent oxidoreductase